MFHRLFLWLTADAPAANRKELGDTIFLRNAQASDSAVYQCEASNRHGSLLANANIMIMSEFKGFWLNSSDPFHPGVSTSRGKRVMSKYGESRGDCWLMF